MVSRIVGLLLVLLMSVDARADTITVAVASNFTAAMTEIAAAFEGESGDHVSLAFGSSGKLYAQIHNGAPFQAFFSADQAKPQALAQDDLVVSGSQFTYAVGALALWSSAPGLVDDQGQILKTNGFNRLALANPRLAPYGTAAVEVLTALGLAQTTRDRWVQGENIAQTYQFVMSGNADIGFVALSQVMENGQIGTGSGWRVPTSLYSPIRQDAVLLKQGEHNETVRAFLAFVKGDTAKSIIESYGYAMADQSTLEQGQ